MSQDITQESGAPHPPATSSVHLVVPEERREYSPDFPTYSAEQIGPVQLQMEDIAARLGASEQAKTVLHLFLTEHWGPAIRKADEWVRLNPESVARLEREHHKAVHKFVRVLNEQPVPVAFIPEPGHVTGDCLPAIFDFIKEELTSKVSRATGAKFGTPIKAFATLPQAFVVLHCLNVDLTHSIVAMIGSVAIAVMISLLYQTAASGTVKAFAALAEIDHTARLKPWGSVVMCLLYGIAFFAAVAAGATLDSWFIQFVTAHDRFGNINPLAISGSTALCVGSLFTGLMAIGSIASAEEKRVEEYQAGWADRQLKEILTAAASAIEDVCNKEAMLGDARSREAAIFAAKNGAYYRLLGLFYLIVAKADDDHVAQFALFGTLLTKPGGIPALTAARDPLNMLDRMLGWFAGQGRQVSQE